MDSRPPLRLDKKTTIELVIHSVPGYLEVLNDCRDSATWRSLSGRFGLMCRRLNIQNYVLLYEDEARIYAALANALMSKELQEEWAKELSALTPEEQQDAMREYGRPGGVWDKLTDEWFPDDPQAQDAQIRAFNELDDDDKCEGVRQAQYLFGFFFAALHNSLAVMVHGEKLTSLVPKALAGDRLAFAKAVHVDKSLILEHPGFRDIHAQAIRDGDKDFLDKIVYRLAAPITQGRIQHAGAFMVFAILETLGWLGDFRYREILDICDAVELDRWQNRIEDETAVAKCIAKYRRYQKTGGVSMH